jgi:hypothetical protein
MELSPKDKPAAATNEVVENVGQPAVAKEPDKMNLPRKELTDGATLRVEIFQCLRDIRKYKVKLLQRNRQKQLNEFESRLEKLYNRFIVYDNELLTGQLKMINGPNGLAALTLKSIFGSQLDSQREMIRILLQDCENALSNHQNRANNLTATAIAIIALITSILLGLLSLLVSLIQLYLSPDATIPVNPILY